MNLASISTISVRRLFAPKYIDRQRHTTVDRDRTRLLQRRIYINPYYNITLPLYYLDESALTTSNYILRLFTQESLHGIRRHIVRFPRLATMRLQQRSARRLVGSGYFRDGIGKFAEFQVVLSGLASPTTGPAVPAHQ